jgi:ribosomal protein S6E (S10)
MPFKINISNKGKAYKAESENEFLIGKKIGETIPGKEINEDLTDYELIITGTSDLAGIPGFKGLEGDIYHRRLLTYGQGMHDRRKGVRLRKTARGEEISSKTIQINMKVVKEGTKKFDSLFDAPAQEAPAEEKPTE